jgi:hypothetical protein
VYETDSPQFLGGSSDHLDALCLAVLIKNFNNFQNLPDSWVYINIHELVPLLGLHLIYKSWPIMKRRLCIYFLITSNPIDRFFWNLLWSSCHYNTCRVKNIFSLHGLLVPIFRGQILRFCWTILFCNITKYVLKVNGERDFTQAPESTHAQVS